MAFNLIYAITGEIYNNRKDDVTLSEEARRLHAEQLDTILHEAPSIHLWDMRRRLDGIGRDYDCWAGRVIVLVEDDTTVFPNGGCPESFALGRLRDFDYSFEKLMGSAQATKVMRRVARCRECAIPCESMTTLRGPEALAGWKKSRRLKKTLDG